MEVGLGLYLSCEWKKRKKRGFLLPVKALEAMPKVRYWHCCRKVSPNVWLPPQESTPTTPFLSLWTVSKGAQWALWLMLQGTKEVLGSLENNLWLFFEVFILENPVTMCGPPHSKQKMAIWAWNILLEAYLHTCPNTRLETWKHAEGKRRFSDVGLVLIGAENAAATTY